MAVRNCSQRCSPPAQAPAPARRVRGAARARVARVRGARAGVPAAARAFARTVWYSTGLGWVKRLGRLNDRGGSRLNGRLQAFKRRLQTFKRPRLCITSAGAHTFV